MAFLNEIGAGRYNRFFQKLLNMKGGPPTRSLSSDLIPVLPLMHGRENRYLEDWRTYGARATVGAVAAQDSVARLTNPFASNVVAVVESIQFSTSVADEVVLENTVVPAVLTVLGSQNTAVGFDPRFNPIATGSGGAVCLFTFGNNVAQGARVIWLDYLTQANIQTPEIITNEDQQVTLFPGTDLQIRELVLNSTLRINVRWRERPIEDSEKA